MKFPRDISGEELAKCARKLGYVITRQSGSHLRLTTTQNGQHHITVPNHQSIKTGTLSAIIFDISSHFNKSKDWVISTLFSK